MESTAAVNSGNLVHLEEYVDTIISLPHEIQRNLTMIKEHDSQVQETEKDLFKDINEFMSLQNKTKEISTSERVELIKRMKNSFLSTLTHCEEKVSLANQCYNSVEKHLIKMEEDLKCFEEEIRLAGYAELLEKVRIERQRQKEQVRNKKRRESALMNETEDSNDEEDNGDNEDDVQGNGQETSDSSNEQQAAQQQQQQQNAKKKKTSVSRNSRRQPTNSNSSVRKQVDSDDEGDEVLNTKVSRAERLLRRNKPNYVSNDSKDQPVEDKNKADAIDNQGDDEAEENDNDEGSSMSSEESEAEREEPEGSEVGSEAESEAEGQKQSDKGMTDSAPTTLTVNPSRPSRNSLTGSASSSDDRDRSTTSTTRRPSKPPANQPGNEPIYCTCQRVSFGQMIACDGKECPIEWFHIECVGLKSLPKGKWYCKECQEAMDAKTAAQLATGMSTRSSRRTQ